jgi:hypothetical protein
MDEFIWFIVLLPGLPVVLQWMIFYLTYFTLKACTARPPVSSPPLLSVSVRSAIQLDNESRTKIQFKNGTSTSKFKKCYLT